VGEARGTMHQRPALKVRPAVGAFVAQEAAEPAAQLVTGDVQAARVVADQFGDRLYRGVAGEHGPLDGLLRLSPGRAALPLLGGAYGRVPRPLFLGVAGRGFPVFAAEPALE